jgi:hypothetical protein
MNRTRSRRRKEAEVHARSFSTSLRRRPRGSWSQCAQEVASVLPIYLKIVLLEINDQGHSMVMTNDETRMTKE